MAGHVWRASCSRDRGAVAAVDAAPVGRAALRAGQAGGAEDLDQAAVAGVLVEQRDQGEVHRGHVRAAAGDVPAIAPATRSAVNRSTDYTT